MSGGDYIYVVVFIILSFLLSYNFFSYYFIKQKSKYINLNNFKFKLNFKFKKNLFQNYLIEKSKRLFYLGNPYGFTLIKFLIFKYILSTFIFFVFLYRTSNILVSILFYLIFFKLPNMLIFLYKKVEGIKIINDISNIVQSLILSLSANMSFYESLKLSANNIENKRFKLEYENFINEYMLYNFNIIKALNEFEKKFDCYEFNIFLSILVQGEKEGELLENLENFSKTLDLIYFRYLKYKSTQRIVFVSIATVISVINSFFIVMYPIVIQITQNLSEIFK